MCGFDLACHAQEALAGLLDWLVGFLDFRTLVVLWIGTAIGARLGWPALIAMTGGILLLWQRKDKPEPDYEDGGDRPVRKTAPIKRKSLFERLTGRPD